MSINFDFSNLKDVETNHLKLIEKPCGLEYNSNNFILNGKSKMLIMAEFHFSRYDNADWEKEILKIKASGVNIITTYIFWIHHEEKKGNFDFTEDKNIRLFVELCKKHDMLVLVRIGPWCHGEVLNGGFPKFIQYMVKKRTDNAKYLQYVAKLFSNLSEQLKGLSYYDGGNIIGAQIENEFGGVFKHILTLKKIAEDCGMNFPLCTVTAWPNLTANDEILPMFGRYAEAPWTQHMRPLEPNDSFIIDPSRTVTNIGTDLFDIDDNKEEKVFKRYPYSSCETGAGIQVTHHRRPIISTQDSYGIVFGMVAKGLNFIGYYVYHGGRNPRGGIYQENRRATAPNNLPISSYDFQAPIGEYGYLKESYHELKLLHFMMNSFDDFVTAQPLFPASVTKSVLDFETPRLALRMNKNGTGYLMISTYQRLYKLSGLKNETIEIKNYNFDIDLPKINIPKDSQVIFPINKDFGGIKLDYITAQPITFVENEDSITYYFKKFNGVEVLYSTKMVHTYIGDKTNNLYTVTAENVVFASAKVGKKTVNLVILNPEVAKKLWMINNDVMNGVIFSDNTVYYDKHSICFETGEDIQFYTDIKFNLQKNENKKLLDLPQYKKIVDFDKPNIIIKSCAYKRSKYSSFVYTFGRRFSYEIDTPSDLFEKYDDIKLEFEFKGNIIQVYCNNELVADAYNYNEKFELGLRRFKEFIEKGHKLIIHVAPFDKVHKIYTEFTPVKGEAYVLLKKITPIKYVKIEKSDLV